MIYEHLGKSPNIDPSAFVAPTAVVCGDVSIGPGTYVGFGAVLVAEGQPLAIGADCVVMENAVLRSTAHQALRAENHVLVGPHAYLVGCEIGEHVFLATSSCVFNEAVVGARAEVRIQGIVHLKTVLPPDTTVPIGWIAVGAPAIIRPSSDHDEIWAVQKPLNFPKTVFGIERKPAAELMQEMTTKYARALRRHRDDKRLDGASEE